jgi:hypothetical protein
VSALIATLEGDLGSSDRVIWERKAIADHSGRARGLPKPPIPWAR